MTVLSSRAGSTMRPTLTGGVSQPASGSECDESISGSGQWASSPTRAGGGERIVKWQGTCNVVCKLTCVSSNQSLINDLYSCLVQTHTQTHTHMHTHTRTHAHTRKGITPKLSRPWCGPYVVTKKLNDLVYRIQVEARTKPRLFGCGAIVEADQSSWWTEPALSASADSPTGVLDETWEDCHKGSEESTLHSLLLDEKNTDGDCYEDETCSRRSARCRCPPGSVRTDRNNVREVPGTCNSRRGAVWCIVTLVIALEYLYNCLVQGWLDGTVCVHCPSYLPLYVQTSHLFVLELSVDRLIL